jgi:membrane protease YdiL (CAAX protease family)
MSDDSSKSRSGLGLSALWQVIRLSLAVAVVVVGPQVVAGIVIGLAGWDIDDLTQPQQLSLALWSSASPALVLLWVLSFTSTTPFERLRLKRVPVKTIFLIGKAFVFYFVASLILRLLLDIFWPQVNLDQSQELGVDQPSDWISATLLLLSLVVLTPISEELIFRGFFFNGLRRHMPWVVAAVVSATLFGAAHLQLNVAVDVGAMGFASAWLLQQTDSVVPSILLHALKNALAFVLVFGADLL